MYYFRLRLVAIIALLRSISTSRDVSACTGITLKAKDGAVVYGRTME